jgi:hypothetical protein
MLQLQVRQGARSQSDDEPARPEWRCVMLQPMLHQVYLVGVLAGLLVPLAGIGFFTRRNRHPAVGREVSRVVWCPHHQRHTVVVVERTRDERTSHLGVGCSLASAAQCHGGCHIFPEPDTGLRLEHDNQPAVLQ